MEATKVGIREFRADLAELIAASSPVAVTRQGKIVGYFIPVHGEAEADLVALKKSSQSLDKLLSAPGVDVEDIVKIYMKRYKWSISDLRRELPSRWQTAMTYVLRKHEGHSWKVGPESSVFSRW